MKVSKAVLHSIKSNNNKGCTHLGNWDIMKNDDLISVYYYHTLVALYGVSLKRLVLVYDYSISTKCGLTKIKNELVKNSLIDELFYTNRNFDKVKEIKL